MVDDASTLRLNLAAADAAAAAVRRQARASSLPLLVVGTVGTAASLLEWADDDPFTIAFLLGPITVVVLAALGRHERRRAARTGLSGVANYSLAALVLLAVGLLVIPLVLIGLAGPYLAFAIVLVVFGLRDHRPRLVAWCAVLGAAGTAENYYALTNRLPYNSWTDSLHYAILVAVGVLFVVAGLIERQYENRAR